MNAVKTFLLGMIAMLILTIVGYAVWIITQDGRSSNTSLVNTVPVTQPRQGTNPGSVIMTVVDATAEPVIIHNLVPVVTEPAPTAAPENVIEYAVDVLAQPTRDYNITGEQLAACLQAQQTGRRLAPYCPPNPAEYAGPGR